MSHLPFDKVQAHNRYAEKLKMRFNRAVLRHAAIDMERILDDTKSRRKKRRRNAERLKDVEVQHMIRKSGAEFRERVTRELMEMLQQYDAGVHPNDIKFRDPEIAALEAMEKERKPPRRRRWREAIAE